MENLNIYVILLAGGTGSRLKNNIPKQLIPIKGKPLILYSFEIFWNWFQELKKHQINYKNYMIAPQKIIIVSNEEYLIQTKEVIPLANSDILFTKGGNTRHDSTRNGLEAIQEEIKKSKSKTLIYIHDTARPLFSLEELNNLYKDMIDNQELGIASLAAKQTETLVQVSSIKEIEKALNRDEIYLVKTPQVLDAKWLDLFIHEKTKSHYTDLLTWGIEHKIKSKIVENLTENIKITYPQDIDYFEFLLSKKNI